MGQQVQQSNIDIALIDKIVELYLSENIKSVEDISIQLKLPVMLVKTIIEDRKGLSLPADKNPSLVGTRNGHLLIVPNTQNDRVAKLNYYVDTIHKLFNTAKFEYVSSPDEKKASVVNSFASTSANIIKQIEAYEDKAKLAEEVLSLMRPMFENVVGLMTTSFNKLLSEASQNLSKDAYIKLDLLVKEDIFIEFGQSLRHEYDALVIKISDMFGAALYEDAKIKNKNKNKGPNK